MEFDRRPKNSMDKLISNDQLKIILRASPSGSFTIRQSLSQSMVLFVSGSDGSQGTPGMLGLTAAQSNLVTWRAELVETVAARVLDRLAELQNQGIGKASR